MPGAGLAADGQRAATLDRKPGEEVVRGPECGVAFPQPAGRGRLGAGLRVVGDRAAPTAALGEVVAPVGAGQEVLGGYGVGRVGGHAEADGHAERWPAG